MPTRSKQTEELPKLEEVVAKEQTVSMTMEALANQYMTLTRLVNENMQLREYVAKLEAYIKDSQKESTNES